MSENQTSLCRRHAQAASWHAFLGFWKTLYMTTERHLKWNGAKKRENVSLNFSTTSRSVSSKQPGPSRWTPDPWTQRDAGCAAPGSRVFPGESHTQRQKTGEMALTYLFPFPCSLVLRYCCQHVGCLLSSHHWDTSIWPNVKKSWAMMGRKEWSN